MTETYSHTTWLVKPGREAEFVRRWEEWAKWSHRQGLGTHARGCRALRAEDVRARGPMPPKLPQLRTTRIAANPYVCENPT